MVISLDDFKNYTKEDKFYLSDFIYDDFVLVDNFVHRSKYTLILNCIDKIIKTPLDLGDSLEYKIIENSFKKHHYLPCDKCIRIKFIECYFFLINNIINNDIEHYSKSNWCFCCSFKTYIQCLDNAKKVYEKYKKMKKI